MSARKLIQGKRVYISGPMLNLRNNNKEMFIYAEKWLQVLGVRDVFNPVRLKSGLRRAEYFRLDINALTDLDCPVDAVIFLPGWYLSSGALLERTIAAECGMICIFIPNPKELLAGRDVVMHKKADGSYAAILNKERSTKDKELKNNALQS